ncbi:Gp15 family bacteriophage protein [Listeria valentina]|uniref:Gp15 family bacteriophage protein n=1 Tax=Listeria valentina TaxID=2705293 RepID=UPI001FE4F2DE|nr:Gp15 family bacteriophage protein [Listeria valentina]
MEPSFLSCYQMRLRTELKQMTYDEFVNLLTNLDGDTPFMKTLQIRMTSKKDLPEYLHAEKTRQNLVMAERGYFKQAETTDDGLYSLLKGEAKGVENCDKGG